MELLPLVALLLGVQVAIHDLYARRVSNRGLMLATGLALVALAWQWLIGGRGFPGTHLLGFALGLLSLLPFYAIGWMGAGDVKLFSVIGFLLGGSALLPIWLIASLAAGAHALIVIAWAPATRCAPLPLQRMVQSLQGSNRVMDWQMDLRSARRGRRGIPYAAYMGMAMIGTIVQGAAYV